MKRGKVLSQGPAHHKNQQKNVKLTFQEFVLNLERGGPFEQTRSKMEKIL